MKVNVAIVQARSEYLRLQASVDKAIHYIEKAAAQGADLITFGETWLTGYPTWLDHCPGACLWNHKPTKEVYSFLRKNSPTIPGKEIDALARTAKKHGVIVVMGLNERVDMGPGNGTLYNSLITIGTNGDILNHHRKLTPTYTERLVWGPGDGDGLKAVDTGYGRVGGLICWEHWMPLTRQALHNEAEQIHISVWPTVNEMHQIASRHYAFEGRSYVMATGLIESVADLPPQFELQAGLYEHPDQLLQRGGSAIIGPDGQYIAGPVYDEEMILTAEIDLEKIDAEQLTLDVTGHYSRDDIFSFDVKKKRRN
ncbi:carbon-nitrogen hydrolase family protein [Lentibacillus sp. CBA3610]|uniref:carbon-nitrogen hydrolase family protein n=1 Tax=Lentibacillus sp. CBA3610 TaxID=2518176 RepID=UPI0015954AB4|nr:carbon-nitrogen hydrolase family protein [Lentibacillus sp. CBA3610]QKY69640.1 carbon-nitrogen hydrolase family protein [Lentibacillus sp. CBA3610]